MTPHTFPMRLAAALPDAVTSGFFLLVWIAPMYLGAGTVKNAMLIMLVEFLLVHAAGFLGSAAYSPKTSRRSKAGFLLGFGLFYLLFVGAFSAAFQAWWPFLAFGWLLLAKFSVAFDSRARAADQLQRMMSGWALSVVAYIGGVVLTLFLPLPRLGMTQARVPEFALPGSGIWVEEPHIVIAFGFLYFGFLALAKLRDWAAPDGPAPARAK